MLNKIIVVTILIIVVLSSIDCPLPPDQQSSLFSDSIKIVSQENNGITNSQHLLYKYPFKQPFTQVPNVGIGLNEIIASESPHLQIRISNSRTTQDGIYFEAKSGTESKWKNFKINFIASSRQDIEIGTSTIQNPIQNSHDSFDINYNVRGNFNSSGTKVRSFLQSIDLQSTDDKIGIRTQRSTFLTPQLLYFTFSNPNRTSIIRLLTISVIIYNIHTPGVLYADGVMDQNFVVSKTEITIPRHGINQLRTYLVGINSFETSTKGQISISSAIDETFRLIIGPINRNQIDYISVSYLILSIVDCGSCEGYPLLFDGLCNVNCPEGTQDRGGRCIKIECPNGYISDSNGRCIPQCQQNEQYDREVQRCVCSQGFYLIYGKCRACPIGTYYDYKRNGCLSICSKFSSYDPQSGKCYCLQGYYLINGICQSCSYETYYHEESQTCKNICLDKQVYTPQGCKCANGYYRIQGICSRCPYKQIWNPTLSICDCPPGYQLIFGNCFPACKIYEQRVHTHCSCLPGYYYINGQCGRCQQNSQYDSLYQQCKCIYPYRLVGGKCVIICPQNSYLDNQTNKCIPYCPQHTQVFINGECICHQDFQRSPKDGICIPKCGPLQFRDKDETCVCMSGYLKNAYGQCRPINCPPNTAWNSEFKDCISVCKMNEIFIFGRCVCQEGYSRGGFSQTCLKDCLWYENRDQYGICQCPQGYKRNRYGQCSLQCPQGSHQKNGICVCDYSCNHMNITCGYDQIYDPLLKRCKCPSGSVWVLGRCKIITTCGDNQYWSGNKCTCKHGYYFFQEKCHKVTPSQQCPPNSVFNGVNCLCIQGFYPVKPGTCQRCPNNHFWNGKYCTGNSYQCYNNYVYNNITRKCMKPNICGQNEEWDGVNCRCKQGYFWIHSQCKSCPYGTFFDGLKCTEGSGIQCKDPYSVWNGQKCICIPGYYPLSEIKCVNCPEGTYWNGQCCKINYHYQFSRTIA